MFIKGAVSSLETMVSKIPEIDLITEHKHVHLM